MFHFSQPPTTSMYLLLWHCPQDPVFEPPFQDMSPASGYPGITCDLLSPYLAPTPKINLVFFTTQFCFLPLALRVFAI